MGTVRLELLRLDEDGRENILLVNGEPLKNHLDLKFKQVAIHKELVIIDGYLVTDEETLNQLSFTNNDVLDIMVNTNRTRLSISGYKRRILSVEGYRNIVTVSCINVPDAITYEKEDYNTLFTNELQCECRVREPILTPDDYTQYLNHKGMFNFSNLNKKSNSNKRINIGESPELSYSQMKESGRLIYSAGILNAKTNLFRPYLVSCDYDNLKNEINRLKEDGLDKYYIDFMINGIDLWLYLEHHSMNVLEEIYDKVGFMVQRDSKWRYKGKQIGNVLNINTVEQFSEEEIKEMRDSYTHFLCTKMEEDSTIKLRSEIDYPFKFK